MRNKKNNRSMSRWRKGHEGSAAYGPSRRGRSQSCGGRGGGRRGGHRQEHNEQRTSHNDQPSDGYIPLSGKAYHSQRQDQGRHPKKSKAFLKAYWHENPSHNIQNSDSDRGLDSDEVDDMEGEEEYLEQQFKWVKEDQDPDRKDRKIKEPEKEPVVIPAGMGWGGALAYHTSASRLKIKDDVETTEPDSIETFTSVSLLAESDTRSARSIAPYQERVAGEGADLAMNAEQFIYTSELLSTAGMPSCASLDSDHKSLEESGHSLWFIDTTPNGAPLEELEVPYIDRPVEYDYSNRKKKKANRSKRGGVREREKQRRQAKAMADDGHILLEDTDDEDDDAELALDDYMENTMNDSMDNHTESFVASALQGRPLEIGHSMEVGGLEPDDLDLSLVGPEYPETWNGMTGVVTSGILNGFKRMVERFIEDEAQPPTMRLPHMSENFHKCLIILAGHYKVRIQTIGTDQERSRVFVRTPNSGFPARRPSLHMLLRVGNSGPSIPRSARSGQPRGRGGRPIRTSSYNNKRQQDWVQDGQDHGQAARGARKGPPGFVVIDGAEIGSSASAISSENVGHRMLSKMGWSPGVGLGATNAGITQPIKAVMKRSRRGLGHDGSSLSG
ncbi:MAG: hypothetical protein J3Q66DRAFT_325142 [Benniella sp.]|nr:MAG: hypothetical protein J3Q66DRAFT_325142 [Benniella sp.]